jgi:hypothetical protein
MPMLDRTGSRTKQTKPDLRRAPNLIPEFSDEFVQRLADSLPDPVTHRQLELLPHILRDWSNNELLRYLSWKSTAIIREENRKLEVVSECARQLLEALDDVGDDRSRIVSLMLEAEGRHWWESSRSEFADLIRRVNEERNLLPMLAAIRPPRQGRRHPRNDRALWVLRDAATIFEWFSDVSATREVVRGGSNETGPFYNFVSVLWPVIFGNGVAGLSATMKKWAAAGTRSGKVSPLIANMDLRHPSWGIRDLWGIFIP